MNRAPSTPRLAPTGARRLPALAVAAGLALLGLQVACGADGPVTARTGPSAGGVTFNGSVRGLVRPSSLATPNFLGVNVALVSYEALADPNQATPAVLVAGPVQSAASSCMAQGCSYHLGNLVLGDTARGLFARPDAAGGDARAQWQPVYTLVASPNQVALSRANGGAISGFAPATLPSSATVANLARLAGLQATELLARGATLAFVSGSREKGDTIGDGVSSAYLTLPEGPTGATLLYPAESYQTVQTNGTNADGAVLVVGPAPGAADLAPTSYAYPVKISVPGAGLTFADVAVFVRPGALVLHTLLPIR